VHPSKTDDDRDRRSEQRQRAKKRYIISRARAGIVGAGESEPC
jgi:hypothetical protein